MHFWNRVFVAILVLCLISGSAVRTLAQSAAPTMRITQAGFLTPGTPRVTADLTLMNADGSFRSGLTKSDFKVFEDDKPIPDSDFDVVTETAGLAVVIVLDTGKYVSTYQGVIGATRWDDLHAVSNDDRAKDGLINELVKYRLNDPADWIGLVGVTEEVTPVLHLDNDGNLVLNSVVTMTPYPRQTPLRAGITRARALFESPDVPASLPPNAQKVILVFSDGIDIINNEEIYSDFIRRAADEHIAYYTVGMKSPNSREGGGDYEPSGLKRLAQETGGVFSEYGSAEQRTEVLNLFDRLATQRQQYRLTYMTHAAKGTHALRIETADGQAKATTSIISPFQMPTLKIEAAPLDLQKGETVIITPTWQENDGYPRDPARIEYRAGTTIIYSATTATGAPFSWNTSTLPDRSDVYTLEAIAYDSILQDAPPAISNQIAVKVTLPPEKVVTTTVSNNWLPLLLLIPMILLLIIVIPNRKKITQTARATTQRLQVATRRLAPLSAARYKLMALSLGQEFPLTEKIVRIGRDPNSMIALNDPGVSLVHADLIEDQSGTYMIVDLTSTNGTYVNGQQLQRGPAPGQPGPAVLLRPGDIVRVGGVELRFDYAKATRRLP